MDTTETSEFDKLWEKYSPFILEIRKRIITTFSLFVVSMIFGFVFYEHIIKILINILSLKGINIVFTSPFQFINLAISCGIATGLVAVFPLFIYQVLSFLRPALKKREFRLIVKALPFSLLLFVIGFAFGIVVMKWQIQLFLTKSISLGIGNILDISHLITTVLIVSVFMGIAFQFPIVVYVLTRTGIIEHDVLRKQRVWIYCGALLFAILLPIDSIMADFLLASPIIILFELTLLSNRVWR